MPEPAYRWLAFSPNRMLKYIFAFDRVNIHCLDCINCKASTTNCFSSHNLHCKCIVKRSCQYEEEE